MQMRRTWKQYKEKIFLQCSRYRAQIESFAYSDTCLAKCKQRNKFALGDSCEYITPGKVGQKFEFTEMYDENMNAIDSCPHPQQVFYIKTKAALLPGDLIRK